MMLNTYDGECHEASSVVSWLNAAGIRESVVLDLETDSSVILAGEILSRDHLVPVPLQWADIAISEGFRRAVPIPVEKIATAPWVRLKCRYGCDGYGKNLQCPPNGRDYVETERLMRSYQTGDPSGRGPAGNTVSSAAAPSREKGVSQRSAQGICSGRRSLHGLQQLPRRGRL